LFFGAKIFCCFCLWHFVQVDSFWCWGIGVFMSFCLEWQSKQSAPHFPLLSLWFG